MQNCTLFDEDPAESARCLFAMPSLALSTGNATMVASAVTQTIQFVLNSGGERRECRGSLPGGQVACLFGVQVWLLAIRVGQVFCCVPRLPPSLPATQRVFPGTNALLLLLLLLLPPAATLDWTMSKLARYYQRKQVG